MSDYGRAVNIALVGISILALIIGIILGVGGVYIYEWIF
jgi:hypothetical protein